MKIWLDNYKDIEEAVINDYELHFLECTLISSLKQLKFEEYMSIYVSCKFKLKRKIQWHISIAPNVRPALRRQGMDAQKLNFAPMFNSGQNFSFTTTALLLQNWLLAPVRA